MSIERIASAAFESVAGRLRRAAILAAVVAVCVGVALYQFTAAGALALAEVYGVLYAHLIVGAVYALVGLIAVLALRQKKAPPRPLPIAEAQQRPMQLAMLVESVMLGYSLARKSGREVR